MKQSTALFETLAHADDDAVKITALAGYFGDAPEADKMHCLALLSGRCPRRVAPASEMLHWAAKHVGLPSWLMDASMAVSGDLTEVISNVLPSKIQDEEHTLTYWINYINGISILNAEQQELAVLKAWNTLDADQRFFFTKLLSGTFRVRLEASVLASALARISGHSPANIAYRLAERWSVENSDWNTLIHSENRGATRSEPFAFQIATQVNAVNHLGDVDDWFATQNIQGLPCQITRRGGEFQIWAQDHTLITDRFADLSHLGDLLPDGTVVSGQIHACLDGEFLPFDQLQNRLSRKSVTKKMQQDAPAVLVANDVLEFNGIDCRNTPSSTRRTNLEGLARSMPSTPFFRIAPEVRADTWDILNTSRNNARASGALGLHLVRRDSVHSAPGSWVNWPTAPLTLRAVLIYATSSGAGGASQFQDFTFGVQHGNSFTPIAKTGSSLDPDITTVLSDWIKTNIQNRFGPVREVTPTQVFKIAFDAIQAAPRRKSGIALRNPRVIGWLQDAPVDTAHTLDDVKEMQKTNG